MRNTNDTLFNEFYFFCMGIVEYASKKASTTFADSKLKEKVTMYFYEMCKIINSDHGLDFDVIEHSKKFMADRAIEIFSE